MSAAQKDQNETMKERDAARPDLSEDQIQRIMRRALDERDAAAPAPVDPPLFTPRQWKAAGAIMTLFTGVLGGTGYAGVATLTDAEVTARDEAHRKVVEKAFDRGMVRVDARVDSERAEFKEQLGALEDDREDTRARVAKIESYNLILKDRDSRK